MAVAHPSGVPAGIRRRLSKIFKSLVLKGTINNRRAFLSLAFCFAPIGEMVYRPFAWVYRCFSAFSPVEDPCKAAKALLAIWFIK
jgi:hypothetical protein